MSSRLRFSLLVLPLLAIALFVLLIQPDAAPLTAQARTTPTPACRCEGPGLTPVATQAAAWKASGASRVPTNLQTTVSAGGRGGGGDPSTICDKIKSPPGMPMFYVFENEWVILEDDGIHEPTGVIELTACGIPSTAPSITITDPNGVRKAVDITAWNLEFEGFAPAHRALLRLDGSSPAGDYLVEIVDGRTVLTKTIDVSTRDIWSNYARSHFLLIDAETGRQTRLISAGEELQIVYRRYAPDAWIEAGLYAFVDGEWALQNSWSFIADSDGAYIETLTIPVDVQSGDYAIATSPASLGQTSQPWDLLEAPNGAWGEAGSLPGETFVRMFDVVAAVDLVGDGIANFDGAGEHVVSSETFADFSDGFTVEAWVRYDRFNQWARIIDFADGAAADNIIFANPGDFPGLAFEVYDGDGVSGIYSDEVLETGEWMHVAATVDEEGNAFIYKNGEVVASGEVSVPNSLQRSSNYVGRSNWEGDGYFAGDMAELRIWATSRTQTQIIDNMDRVLNLYTDGRLIGKPLETGQMLGSTQDGAAPEPVATEAPKHVLLDDDFSDPASGLGNMEEAESWGVSYYVPDEGVYLFEMEPESWAWWSYDFALPESFDVTVTGARYGSADNAYGVVFQRVTDQDFYMFIVSGNGNYLVGKMVDGNWQTLIDWTDTDAVLTGEGELNSLGVVGANSEHTLFINGQAVGSFWDGDLHGGSVGPLVNTYAEPGVFVFDQLQVVGQEPEG